MLRSTFVRAGYLSSFSDLMGSVHVFRSDDPLMSSWSKDEEGKAWNAFGPASRGMLCSTARHSVYPALDCSPRSSEVRIWKQPRQMRR